MFQKQMPRIMGDKEMIASAMAATRKTPPPKEMNRPRYIRLLEAKKIFVFAVTVTKHLHEITKKTPKIEELDPFYLALAGTMVDIDKFKNSLGAVLWAEKEIRRLEMDHKKIVWEAPLKDVGGIKKRFFGRAASVLKQISKDLAFLERTRKAFFRIPEIKQVPTYVLAGMPNVGKSSLLKALTGASPEIQPYPFTTKGLLLGYIDEQVQIIDTPGLLERPLSERNNIELQAILAIKHAAGGVIFVYDPTASSGYSPESQKALFLELKDAFSGLPFIVCITKSDLATEEEINAAKGVFSKEAPFLRREIAEVSSETQNGISELRLFLKKDAKTLRAKQAEPKSRPSHVPAREIKQI